MTGTARIIRGDARSLPLEDDSVDLVCTSPPYFALRSYQDGGTHYSGQIGDEATPAEFVDALLEVTRECVRVLKPSGSLWVNLGDKYAQSAAQWGGSRRGHQGILAGTSADEASQFGVALAAGAPSMGSAKPKSLIGIPWRYAIRCIDELGLILRAEVIWSKPNGLPESVTDRVRRSHEQWFHFTLQPRYFSAVDEIREEHQTSGRGSDWETRKAHQVERGGYLRQDDVLGFDNAKAAHPLGKLPGSVWTIPTEPLIVPPELGVDHFAAFPTEWPRRIIQGWSPAGVCVECGEGRRPVAEQTDEAYKAARAAVKLSTPRDAMMGGKRGTGGGAASDISNGVVRPSYAVTGYACACPEPTAPTTPGVVLDPFGGTGTTALVAKALGRTGISVDMSADYCRLAQWRTNDPAQLAKAARKPHTPSVKPIEGQSDLLDMLAEESA